jgi:DNA polymerase elongation subunit (family B)
LDGQGYVNMPPEIDALRLAVGGCVYKMGIGGLHSTEHVVAHKADADTMLIDRDVASYYPSIILNQRLYPKHLGQAFLKVYESIVKRRLEAKHKKNKIVADSLKITINGSFGKFGSRWSVLYAPDLLIQVTITGQLALLMLIEMIEDLGVPVVSANTDGVLIKCPRSRYDDLQARIRWWEALTFFETEETLYKDVYSRDVNNYLAVKEKGDPKAKFLDERLGIKAKGCYGERGSAGNSVLSKNPEVLICNDAVMELIATGKPIEQTIRECKDIRRFVTIRKVTGGARKSEQYLGKVIRWYYSTEMKGEINRATKGDKIPNSDGARPLMELPNEFPTDIDYNRYIDASIETLHDIGYYTGLSKASKRCLGGLFEEDGQEAYHLNG